MTKDSELNERRLKLNAVSANVQGKPAVGAYQDIKQKETMERCSCRAYHCYTTGTAKTKGAKENMVKDDYMEAAKKAIDDLFSDTTVSQQTTVDKLEELRDEIEMKIDAIKGDIKSGRS